MIRLLPALFVLLGLPVLVLADSLRPPHLELDVQLDPATRQLVAKANLSLYGDTLNFTLDPALSVTELTLDGRSRALSGVNSGARSLNLGGPGLHHLQLAYHGQLASLSDLDHKDVLGRLPPMADVRGSYLPAGSGWYPDPGEPFSYRLRLRLPVGQKGLVPGGLLHESEIQGYQAEFDFAWPGNGIDLMAGPYVVMERRMERPGQSPLRIRTWFYQDMTDLAEGYLADSARYIARYSQEIGPYPFDAFSVVASPLPTGFGMAGLTYLGRDVLRLPFIRATSLGHEVLHNWWGNGVTPDRETGNWSEGLTTFMADYAFQEDQSAEAGRAARLGWLRDLAAVPESDDTPLTAFTARHHGLSSIVGYNKSAMVFLMLRDAIGAEAFQQGLRLFWQRHRFQRAGWADLQKAFSDAAGRDLDDFFRQWVQRAGAPRLRLAQASWSAGKLFLSLEQTGAPYTLRVPLRLIVYPDKQETRWVEASGSHTEIVVPAPVQVMAVELDPDYRLWRRVDWAYFPPILREVFVAPRAGLLLAGNDPALPEAATLLAERLLDARPEILTLDGANLPGQLPVLVIGRSADVDALLIWLGLAPRPAHLAARGSAQVWAARDRGGRPYVVVSAQDTRALLALQRKLPHYGRQSWLVFETSRVEDKGIWPARVERLVLDAQPLH